MIFLLILGIPFLYVSMWFIVGIIIPIGYYFSCGFKTFHVSFQSNENGGCFIIVTSPSAWTMPDMNWASRGLYTPPAVNQGADTQTDQVKNIPWWRNG